MLKASTFISVWAILVGSLFSCQRTGGAGGAGNTPSPSDSAQFHPGVAVNGCRIVGDTVNTSPGSPAIARYIFLYDKYGWVDSSWSYTSSGPLLEAFQRKGNTIIEFTTGTSINGIDSITVNDDGFVVRDVHSASSIDTYSYNGTQVQQALYPFPPSLLTTTYHWSNGDMIYYVNVHSGGSVDTVTFTYDTLPSVAGDYWHLINMIDRPQPYMLTAHRVISETQGGRTFEYTYVVDSTGKITSMNTTEGGISWGKDNYTYRCP